MCVGRILRLRAHGVGWALHQIHLRVSAVRVGPRVAGRCRVNALWTEGSVAGNRVAAQIATFRIRQNVSVCSIDKRTGRRRSVKIPHPFPSTLGGRIGTQERDGIRANRAGGETHRRRSAKNCC